MAQGRERARSPAGYSMRSFSFLIEDARFGQPTVEFVTVKSIARAKELAAQRLAASPQRISITVSENEQTLFRVARPSAGAKDTAPPIAG